jgi:hypothetical protein
MSPANERELSRYCPQYVNTDWIGIVLGVIVIR